VTGKDNVIRADFRPRVVIVTKRKTYDLGPDAVGQPVEEIFGEATLPSLRGCKRCMTEDGFVIARPE
jgi:hypothetical protein